MLTPDEVNMRAAILSGVPRDGSAIGNIALAKAVTQHMGAGFNPAVFEAARLALVAAGTLRRGAGRGGSLRRALPSLPLQDLADGDEFELQLQVTPPLSAPAKPASKPVVKRATAAPVSPGAPQVISYRHADKRKNNPQVGLVNEASDPPQPKTTWAYDPHLDPALQFDVGRAGVEWGGSRRRFVPDFLVRLTNGKTLVLEIKGEDSAQNQAKRDALNQWVEAVNAKGGFGPWCWAVAFAPAEAHDILARHGR